MDNNKKKSELRAKAERILKEKNFQKSDEYYDNIEKLVEELNIHQIELEMQNQELQEANQKILAEQKRYKELYMQAPIAYFTLNKTGNIIELNEQAANIFKIPIHRFKFTSIFPYLEENSKIVFNKFFKKIYSSDKTEYGEIVFKVEDGSLIYGNLTAVKYFDTILNTELVRCSVVDKTKTLQYEKEVELKEELIKTVEKLNQINFEIDKERQQFISILDNIPENIYVATLDTHEILFANKKLKEVIGRDITGEKCYTAIQQIQNECTFCTNPIIKNSNEPYFWEKYNPVLKKHFYIMNRKIMWTNRKEVRFELAIDITKQKEADRNIKQLNERLENSLNVGEMAWWEMELPSGNTRFNKNKALMLGRNPEDFKHYKDFMEFLHPDDNEQAMQAMYDLLEGRKDNYETEYRIRKTDGEYLWYYDFGKITEKKDGKIIITGIVQNITSKKEADIKIKKSEEIYKALFYQSTVGLVTSDDKGNLQKVNSKLCEILGYPEEELLTKNVIELTHPDDFEKEMKEAKNIVAGLDDDLIITKRFIRKDGKIVWGYMHSHVFRNEKKEIDHIFAAVTDITKQVESEQIIKQKNVELNEAIATKNKFFNIIAHDLKNPFNAILGFTDLLLTHYDSFDNEQRQKFIKELNITGQNAYKLLLNLLEWSRAQTGKIKFNPKQHKLNNIILISIEQVSGAAGNKNITINTNVDTVSIINADYDMLNTILRNLISNAIKFTEEGGSITVEATQSKKETLFCVKDTGVGISAEKIEKLFKVEEKISTKGTNNEQGTGIGLLLCKEFVEKHGGRIWAESQEGKGSEFYFTIPA